MGTRCRRKVMLAGRVFCEVPSIKSTLCKDNCPVIGNISAGRPLVAHSRRDENACLGVSAADLVPQEGGYLVIILVVEGWKARTEKLGLVDIVGE